MHAPIPVTVIGGYLGAGKTTLVNALLREAREATGCRLAVLVNDFGTLPIDEQLIESRDGDTLALAGGCVCCSYGSELVDALRRMAARTPRPEHVMLEASGVALPGAIGATVTLLAEFALDGVVVLADAETAEARAKDRYLGDTIARQLADADLLLATKTDLVDEARRASVLAWLAQRGRTLACERGAVPLALLAGLRTNSRRSTPFSPMRHPDYDTCAFNGLGPLDGARLAALLADPALGVLRAKGVLVLPDGAPAVLHVVGRRSELRDAPVAASAGALVCIGLRGRLDTARIRQSLESLTCKTTT